MRKTLMVPVLAFELLAGTAMAQNLAFPSQALKVNGPSTNDLARTIEVDGVKRLRKTDEEHTNEQGVVQLFADGKLGIYVEMRSSELAGTLPPHNVQGACTPIELVQNPDGSVTAVKKPGERWVTDNDGNESRNAHHPWLVPVGPTEILYTFNYQAQGTSDTKRYGIILDPNCNPRTLIGPAGIPVPYVTIMAKDNDDCSMNEDGGGADTRLMPDGSTRVVMWAGCNGNGRDDGWLNVVDVKCIDDTAGRTCQITKQFDVSLAKREERSRGRCSMSTADPDTAVCTWTEGNNQPQRDGTWIAAVDVSGFGPAPNDGEGRVLWKKLIEGRKVIPPTQSVNPDPNPNPNERMEESRRSYSSRAKSARVLALDGSNNVVQTDLLFVSTGDLVGNNRRDVKGGRYIDSRLGVARATRQGLEWVVPMQSVRNMMVGFDYTHIKMTGVLIQNDGQVLPGVTFLQGSHNGGGVYPPDVKVVAFNQAEGRLIDYGTYQAKGASYDRHLYSNYLGNNPGNQGRNFAGATFVKNPFEGLNGSRTKFLVLHALTGKDPADVASPELKPSSYVSIMELILDGAPPPPVPGLNGTGGPPANGPMSCSSCSTAGGEGAFGLWGAALVLIAARRRRSRGEGARA